MWSLASSAFGRWETPTFLAFPGLPRPRSLTRFDIMPGIIFWYFWWGIIWPQLTVLRISHKKFEWNRRQKKIFFQRGDPLVFFWFSENHQRVPPLNREKFFVSDSTQILCVKSLGHKDCMFWISSKSETKFFFISKGGTLWCFSDFQGLNVKMLIDIYGHKWRDRLPWMLK